jgi:hypothetical protein
MTRKVRIMAILTFQTRRDAERAANALETAGYEVNFRDDELSAAAFMEAWRYAMLAPTSMSVRRARRYSTS